MGTVHVLTECLHLLLSHVVNQRAEQFRRTAGHLTRDTRRTTSHHMSVSQSVRHSGDLVDACCVRVVLVVLSDFGFVCFSCSASGLQRFSVHHLSALIGTRHQLLQQHKAHLTHILRTLQS